MNTSTLPLSLLSGWSATQQRADAPPQAGRVMALWALALVFAIAVAMAFAYSAAVTGRG